MQRLSFKNVFQCCLFCGWESTNPFFQLAENRKQVSGVFVQDKGLELLNIIQCLFGCLEGQFCWCCGLCLIHVIVWGTASEVIQDTLHQICVVKSPPGGPLKEVLGQFGTKNGWSGPDTRGGPVTEVFNSHTKKEEIRDQRKVVLVPRWSVYGGGPHGRFHCTQHAIFFAK